MTTLSQILQQTAIDLGITDSFIATGGTVTTTINTSFADESEPPDEERFKNNYIFVRRDAGGAGAAPEGRYALISAYNPATYTITHATVATAPASGDEMLLVKQNNFPLLEMISAVNRGLRDLGVFPFEDTSLSTAAAKTEYDLPSGVLEVLDVRVSSSADSNKKQYAPVAGWRVVPSPSTFATPPLLFMPQLPTGLTIQIIYNGLHPELHTWSDELYKFIPLPLAIAATKAALLESYVNSKSGSAKPHWLNMYAESLRQKNEFMATLPKFTVEKTIPMPAWSSLKVPRPMVVMPAPVEDKNVKPK